jgi:hypothetical protein
LFSFRVSVVLSLELVFFVVLCGRMWGSSPGWEVFVVFERWLSIRVLLLGGAQSLKSSVTNLLKICCLSWFASLIRLGSAGCAWIPSVVVGRVTPTE